jgi:hypothetical protein
MHAQYVIATLAPEIQLWEKTKHRYQQLSCGIVSHFAQRGSKNALISQGSKAVASSTLREIIPIGMVIDASRAKLVNAALLEFPAGVNGLILRLASRVYSCER